MPSNVSYRGACCAWHWSFACGATSFPGAAVGESRDGVRTCVLARNRLGVNYDEFFALFQSYTIFSVVVSCAVSPNCSRVPLAVGKKSRDGGSCPFACASWE